METGSHHHDRRDAGLQAKPKAKISELDQKIAALTVTRESLVQALDAGCNDLVACAGSSYCPIPVSDLASTHPGRIHAAT